MKKTLVISMILLAFSMPAAADSIIFKDGMRVDASDVWEGNGEVKCKIGGIVFGYPKSDVERIERGGAGKASTNVLKAHKQVTVVPEKETAIRQKDTENPDKKPAMIKQKPVSPEKMEIVSRKETSAPKRKAVISKKETAIPDKEASVPKKPKAASQKAAAAPIKKKAAPAKEIRASKSKKKKSPRAVAPQYAGIPSFKEIINEDDNNPPVYIKRKRVLLVPRGLAKAQIRALLLSYEKKLRNELNNQKAKYKLIVVWVYDDFERADEGAAGWIGKISNQQKTGELSDNPVLSIR